MGKEEKSISNSFLGSDGEPVDFYVEKLIEKAMEAMKFAIAPSSQFRVGASLLGKSGKIYKGCNIESPVYLGICAERVALFKGLSEGEREFVALAVICEEEIPCPPCGTCRQLFWEFTPSLKVILVVGVSSANRFQVHTIEDLLPLPFARGNHNPFD